MTKDKCKYFFEEYSISNWDQLYDCYNEHQEKHKGWVFRGQSKYSWPLESSLDRIKNKLTDKNYVDLEKGLIRRFQRQIHLFKDEIPENPSTMEILSVMQHHGAPTRLLDWTYSFWVAVYFAVEQVEPDKACAVWAIDYEWLRRKYSQIAPRIVKQALAKDKNAKNKTTIQKFFDYPNKAIRPLNPYRLNRRLVLQQGVFLVPGDINFTFCQNLCNMLYDSTETRIKLFKLPCTPEFIKETIYNLHRMNINRATLFPGLDGFSKHMHDLIHVDGALAPYKNK